jgi:hypothetical protein
MKWLSLNDIEQGLKRKIYRITNNTDGSALVWDSEKRTYVGHIEQSRILEAVASGGDIAEWVGYGKGNEWGSRGW